MLPTLHLSLFNNYLPLHMDYSSKIIAMKNKISTLAREVFSCISLHPRALSVAIFTSFFLQTGMTASSTISLKFTTPDSIDNLETCLDTFCAYSNITDPDYYLFSKEICWHKGVQGHTSFTSLEECQYNLKKLYSTYVNTNWNSVCPPTKLRGGVKKMNKYMAQCFKNLCSKHDSIHFMDKNALNWCSLTEVKKSKKALKAISKKRLFAKSKHDSNKWTREDILRVSINSFFEISKNVQSMLSSILSTERLPTLTPEIIKDLNLIKKGVREMLSSPLELIKGLLHDISGNDLPLKVRKYLENFLKKMEEILPIE